MSRIEKVFSDLKEQNKKALVTFVTAGDPDHQTSDDIVKQLSKSGADIIELGMPFSDPMADGPSIQRANIRALNSGATLIKTLQIVKSFRVIDASTPIVLMGYFNPIHHYGTERFVTEAKESGVDGLIIVDVPPEEDSELNEPMRKSGLDLIRLVTPTTDPARLDLILNSASGFLYYVSIAGVTGTKSADVQTVGSHITQIRQKTDMPIVVGFGIKTPDDAKTMSEVADGIVVGSALVDTIEKFENAEKSITDLSEQVSALASAIQA